MPAAPRRAAPRRGARDIPRLARAHPSLAGTFAPAIDIKPWPHQQQALAPGFGPPAPSDFDAGFCPQQHQALALAMNVKRSSSTSVDIKPKYLATRAKAGRPAPRAMTAGRPASRAMTAGRLGRQVAPGRSVNQPLPCCWQLPAEVARQTHRAACAARQPHSYAAAALEVRQSRRATPHGRWGIHGRRRRARHRTSSR